MSYQFDGYLWLLLTLVPLLYLQPKLHLEIQRVFYLLTGRADIAIILFAIVFFPGVLLHELSHFIMARLLGARTGRFSVIPRDLGNGKLQMGFVEVEVTGIIRDSLIGVAPLLAGSAFVAFAGLQKLNLLPLWDTLLSNNLPRFFDLLLALPATPDFWLWAYFTLAVSSTMFPSDSDRHAWWPLAGLILILMTLAWFLGAKAWLLPFLIIGLNNTFRSMSIIFGLAVLGHLLFLIPIMLIRKGIENLVTLRAARQQ